MNKDEITAKLEAYSTKIVDDNNPTVVSFVSNVKYKRSTYVLTKFGWLNRSCPSDRVKLMEAEGEDNEDDNIIRYY